MKSISNYIARSIFIFLFIILTLFSCNKTPTNSEPFSVSFPDANFENLIRETLNKTSEKITNIDMQSILELSGYQRNIRNIKGIEYCTNLKELYLGDNDISDIIPLSNLTDLQNLSLHYNNINDLSPLINLVKLQSLVLADNNISDISPLSNLINLHFLKIGGNNISDIKSLLQNRGIGDGDTLNIVDNPLNEISLNIYIPQLQSRGVILYY